jgi:hypothetical protein
MKPSSGNPLRGNPSGWTSVELPAAQREDLTPWRGCWHQVIHNPQTIAAKVDGFRLLALRYLVTATPHPFRPRSPYFNLC